MSLTDTTIRNAKPGAKPVKLSDERGRFRFTFDGKEKLLSLGTCPDVSLKDARERRDANRTHF